MTLQDGEHSCPKCYGRKGSWDYVAKKWLVGGEKPWLSSKDNVIYNPITIGQVRVSVGYDDDERYMCAETGLGSGTLWEAKNLFTSEREAIAECDRRNSSEVTDEA